MKRSRYLHLSGLNRPAVFENATALEPLVAEILPSWSHSWSDSKTDIDPFAVITPGHRRAWSITIAEQTPKEWDEVDTLCDLVAELAWERLRARPELLSLHAAGLVFSDRLVVFPNVKRAGKSTLSVALARLGHKLFADDVLPVDIDGDSGLIEGMSSGAAPRLRLPVPEGFSEAFSDFVQHDPGPGNNRYKYMTGLPIAEEDERLPLGAIVVLDRRDEPTTLRLDPIERGAALAQVIRQNFSRDQHSGRILKAVEQITRDLPLYRMTYSSGEEAAEFLHTHPALTRLPTAESPAQGIDPSWSAASKQAFEATARYHHAEGLVGTEAEGEMFLSDQSGAAIHRLNAGSMMIWRALEEPATLEEVVELLHAAFPDVPRARIAEDSERTLQRLAKAGLIVPVEAERAMAQAAS